MRDPCIQDSVSPRLGPSSPSCPNSNYTSLGATLGDQAGNLSAILVALNGDVYF